jgi:hypothetical protein
MWRVSAPLDVILLLTQKYWAEGLQMTIAQMITFAVCVLMLWLGYKSGYATGYVDGRKAVRYHYEKLERQFKQVGK